MVTQGFSETSAKRPMARLGQRQTRRLKQQDQTILRLQTVITYASAVAFKTHQ